MTVYKDIEPYLADFLKGEVEEAMEYRIRAYLQANPSFQRELDELEETLAILEKNALEEPKPSLKIAFYAMLNEEKKKQEVKSAWVVSLEKIVIFFQNRRFLGSALAVGLFLIIFFAGYWTSSLVEEKPQNALSFEGNEKSTEEEVFSESENTYEEEDNSVADEENSRKEETFSESENALREDEKLGVNHDTLLEVSEDIDLSKGSSTATNTTTELELDREIPREDIETSDRIQSVYASLDKADTDTQIVGALIKTLNTDPNPNVRIAAIDALERFMSQPKVRLRLAQSLKRQQSPTTQLATLDLLVKYEIKEGKKYIKQFLKQSTLNKTVREQAEIALEVLS